MRISQIAFLLVCVGSIVSIAFHSSATFMRPIFWGGMLIGVISSVASRVVIQEPRHTSN